MIIMQRCMENPASLFEKYTHNVTRATQKEEWKKIVDQLEIDGIYVDDVALFRKNINNWVRRAVVSNFIPKILKYELFWVIILKTESINFYFLFKGSK